MTTIDQFKQARDAAFDAYLNIRKSGGTSRRKKAALVKAKFWCIAARRADQPVSCAVPGGAAWKAISGEFATLEEALDTIKRLHRWYGGKYRWCAECIATGERTALEFERNEE